MAFTREQVAEIYVATFNRAPDASGLDYWVNDSGFTNIEDVASSFFDSDEAAVMYPRGTSTTAMVEAAYQNLFGRDADADGLDYWVEQLDTRVFSQSLMLQAMINGAKDTQEYGNDATMMANKTSVGIIFAEAGQSDIDSAISIMANITDEITTVEAAKITISDMPVSISVESGFTQAYLDGKTFYSVLNWKDSINDADDWVIVKTQYDGINNNFNEYLPSTNNYDSLEVENYSINNGIITNYPTDGNSSFSIQISAIDSEKITISTTASDDWPLTEYLYFNESDAQDMLTELTSPSDSISTFQFTTEYLNDKVFYNVFDENQDGIFDDMTEMQFNTDGTFTGVGFNGVNDSNGTYTIDNNGVMSLLDSGNILSFIMGVKEIDDSNTLQLIWEDSYSYVTTIAVEQAQIDGTVEYFFLDRTSADLFIG